jgi:hypothetical protein
MDGYNIYPDPGKTPWPVIASSLWLRLGFVAATGAVVALTKLYEGEVSILAALAWIIGGAWLTTLSWRRAKASLDRMEDVDGAPEVVTSEATGSRAATHPSWDRREVGAASAAHQVRG